MKHLFLVISLFWLTLLLSSCEGNTDVHAYVHNLSHEPIDVVIFQTLSGEKDSVTLLPGQVQEVMYYNQRGGRASSGTIEEYIDTLEASILGGLASKHYLLSDSLWTVFSIQQHKLPSSYLHEFRLFLKDDDF